LYFLLPPKLTEFELVGRKREDGSVLFPGKYRVKVAGELSSPAEEEPAPEKSRSKDDPDMKESDDEMKKENTK
jgi:hypothetical protein